MVLHMGAEKDESNQNSLREFTIKFDHSIDYSINKKRMELINEFFKRVMFDNPHLTANERKAKAEARSIFQKETLKNLIENL